MTILFPFNPKKPPIQKPRGKHTTSELKEQTLVNWEEKFQIRQHLLPLEFSKVHEKPRPRHATATVSQLQHSFCALQTNRQVIQLAITIRPTC